MTHFLYRKDNNEVSERDIIPIGFNFGDRDTVLCIDATNLTEVDKENLQIVREAYLDSLYDYGFGKDIRSFYLDNIEEISA